MTSRWLYYGHLAHTCELLLARVLVYISSHADPIRPSLRSGLC